ncbi:hypothetical protein HUU05_13595 [candidate division KSB1 bacterium]|nr:hypothetical protein [candidate division KSB1 bacterium]
MLIDDYLPRYDAFEKHSIAITALPEKVYAAARKLDLSGSLLIRGLFFLRTFPALFSSQRETQSRLGLNLAGLLRSGFVLLEEKPGEEIVLGLVGKFWTATGCIENISASQFRDFTVAGFAKAAWNFSLHAQSNGATQLTTETRVLCTDEASRKRFLRYWRFVRPFSGLVRIAALRAIKRAVEREMSV